MAPGPTPPRYYTNALSVPGAVQARVQNKASGQVLDRFQIPGGQLGFTPGHGYYVKQPGGQTGSPMAQAAASDPYGQLTGYQPLTAAQIQQQAQGEISPIIQAITGQAKTQAGQQASQIAGLTQDYANELGQINMAAPYQQGEGQQAAVDAALQQSLTGEGTSLAGGLSDRLAALQGTNGADALQHAANQLSSQGASAGTTQLADGSANLSNLIANAAAGGEFGLKLPAIAKLSGLQALGENASAQQQAVNNATLQAETQIPSIVQNLQANNQTALANAVGAQQKQQALDFENAVKEATLGQNATKINATIANNQARAGIAQQNANTAATRAAQQALNSDRSYRVNLAKIGIEKKAAQVKALAVEAKLKNGGFTPAQLQRYKGTAVTLADQAFNGFTDTKGAAHPKLTYQQAVLEGQKEGLPLSILLPALRQVGYVPPALEKQQEKIAHSLFPSPLDALVNGGG